MYESCLLCMSHVSYVCTCVLVQVTIRLFDALVPALDGFVTTTSDYRPIAGSKAQLSVKTTEVKESSLAQVPVFGQMFQDVKFPTSLALEQVKAGSSEVQLEVIV